MLLPGPGTGSAALWGGLLLLLQGGAGGSGSSGSSGATWWLLAASLAGAALLSALAEGATAAGAGSRLLRRALAGLRDAAQPLLPAFVAEPCSCLTFVGYEVFRMTLPVVDFPPALYALSHHVVRSGAPRAVLRCMTHAAASSDAEDECGSGGWPERREGSGLLGASPPPVDVRTVVAGGTAVPLGHDLWLDVDVEKAEGDRSFGGTTLRTMYTLYAGPRFAGGMPGMLRFVARCEAEYAAAQEALQARQLYHILYTGSVEGQPTFRVRPLAQLGEGGDVSRVPLERFDTLRSPQVARLRADLARLRDVGLHARTGQKRKRGYVFHGPPGSGKTSHAVAMALEDRRHVLEVPFSRLRTNADLEAVLAASTFEGLRLPPDRLLVLFDEMDVSARGGALAAAAGAGGGDAPPPAAADSEEEDEAPAAARRRRFKQDRGDALHLGTLLSRLDGVGAYDGTLFVATTNNLGALPPALVRPGRLTPVAFGPCAPEDVVELCAAGCAAAGRAFTPAHGEALLAALAAAGGKQVMPAEVQAALEGADYAAEAVVAALGGRLRMPWSQ